jgi:aminopeptidase N
MLRLFKPLGLIACGLVYITACKVNKNNASTNNTGGNIAASVPVPKPVKKAPYRATETRTLDVIHMDLEVGFDYTQKHVIGKAVLNCRPYFYDLKTAELDAQGFEIKRVAMLTADTVNLRYEYNGKSLLVFLDRTYKRSEDFSLYISYIAKPDEIKSTAKGIAITDNKGLYFINPAGKDKNKPRQIWTQGETQSNSCWFPTVDRPNEKITHNIAITVESKDITLSNGELMMSRDNPNGTRTDYWKQMKPHAPYLVMLAVGNFAQVKDYWRDSIAVDYYVEPEYKQYAKMVFGNTPEMLEVFSRTLGVDYPWNKYAQIVVRDFVSGAMENTSAVIHYDALQHDTREHLDNTHEDIVAHELFHHWFGDLVTCESWSNIPLNESFATYGEYIWQEHKYGTLEADREFYSNLRAYLGQKNKHKVDPIRYHYYSRDELFDVVSYQKGGCMLHMLRKQVGDEAFFAALKSYLTRHSYKTAEIADLRMAFEEITGEDLNWFFDQWFLQPGHPVLEYAYSYAADRKKVTLTITQKQDSSREAYRLPLKVDVYSNGKATRETIVVNTRNQQFEFESAGAIDFVNPDADKVLPAVIDDNKTAAEYKAMIKAAPLYMDKHYATKGWVEVMSDTLNSDDIETVNYLLGHQFWGIRNLGLSVFEKLDSSNRNLFVNQVIAIASNDIKADNRTEAVSLLGSKNANVYRSTFEKTVNDSSYNVVAVSLEALMECDPELGRSYIDKFKKVKNKKIQYVIASLLAEDGATDEVAYFESTFDQYGYYNFGIMTSYMKYLQLAPKDIQQKAIPGLRNFYQSTPNESMKQIMPSRIRGLKAAWKDRIADLEEEKTAAKKKPEIVAVLDKKIAEAQAMIDAYDGILK